MRIREVNGQYEGRIEKIFPKPGDEPNPKCDKCAGVRHEQPVIGMTILWDLTKQGDEYQGGQILDPENGKHLPCPHEADRQWPKTRCPRIYRFLSIRPKPNLDTRGVSSSRITTEWILGVRPVL